MEQAECWLLTAHALKGDLKKEEEINRKAY